MNTIKTILAFCLPPILIACSDDGFEQYCAYEKASGEIILAANQRFPKTAPSRKELSTDEEWAARSQWIGDQHDKLRERMGVTDKYYFEQKAVNNGWMLGQCRK